MERREAGACAGGGQQEGSRDVGDGEEAGCHTDPNPNPKQKSKFKPSHRELEGLKRQDGPGGYHLWWAGRGRGAGLTSV